MQESSPEHVFAAAQVQPFCSLHVSSFVKVEHSAEFVYINNEIEIKNNKKYLFIFLF